jgi:hypothetical protein
MLGSLNVDGQLQLSNGERNVTLTAEGSRIQAEIGDFPTDFFSLLRLGVNVKRARLLSRQLQALKMTLVITRDGVSLAELGSGVRTGPLARLRGLLRLLFQKRR